MHVLNPSQTRSGLIPVAQIEDAYSRIAEVALTTPLAENLNLSEKYGCNLFLKREDLQVVRSYKIRGAFNRISSLEEGLKKKGVICASAGNHAQGVAYSCRKLGVFGKIYMPHTTPKQKVKQVKMFGRDFIEIVLTGDNFDECYHQALQTCKEEERTFIHPFDDEMIIAGQGTVGMEILRDCPVTIDYVFVPIGGGGLASGLGSYFKQLSPRTKIIGVEPLGAPAMKRSLKAGKIVELSEIDKFVDGASVKRVGENTLHICKEVLDDEVVEVHEGKICTTILQLYNEEAIVVEPAGALSIAALDSYADAIKGKNVVCVVSGGNNDITRTEEIKERSLLYEGLKHYFIVRFPQRAGALKEFLVNVLGPEDDISHFEYTKKNSRESGPALVGIEVKRPKDFDRLIERMDLFNINYQLINQEPDLFNLLV